MAFAGEEVNLGLTQFQVAFHPQAVQVRWAQKIVTARLQTPRVHSVLCRPSKKRLRLEPMLDLRLNPIQELSDRFANSEYSPRYRPYSVAFSRQMHRQMEQEDAEPWDSSLGLLNRGQSHLRLDPILRHRFG